MTHNITIEKLQSAIAARRHDVDYLEIRVEQSEATSLSFRGQQLDGVDRNFALAGGIRACHQGGWSFVTFNGLQELSERVDEAIAQAKIVGTETTQLAPIEPIEDYVAAEIKRDPRGIDLEEKRRLLEAYNQLILDYDPRIQTTMTSLRDRFYY